MSPGTRSIRWSLLAVATAAAMAPIAWSATKPAVVATHTSNVDHSALGRAAAATAAPAGHDRFIVTYRSDARRMGAATVTDTLAAASKGTGIRVVPMRTLGTGAALVRTDRKLDAEAHKRLVVELMKDPNVLAVEPDRLRKPLLVPDDPLYSQQWHYKDGPGGINVEPAWDLSTGAGSIVAVLDTGSTPHSELVDQYVAGYDFIIDTEVSVDGDGRDADPNDPGDWHAGECNIFGIPEDSSWHGTHVAGTIGAATNNGNGVAGVAFGGKVQPVRVLGKCGGYESDIIDAVTWASGGSVPGVPDNATPANVINLSLGGGGACSVAEQAAFTAAVGRGSTVVVAAGNSGADAAGYSPASCNDVITVSAVGPTGTLASYSNFGDTVSVAAPGGSGANPAADNILSTYNLGLQGQEGEAYAWSAGTSMAAPHVAGVVALMQAAAASPKSPAEIQRILENTAYASNGFPAGCDHDKPCGAGVIDARHAVAVASGAEPLPADPPPPPPPPPGIPLQNGAVVTDISVLADESIVYQIEVPNGASQLFFGMYGGTGDADLYVRHGARPTDSAYDCRPYLFGNDENCYFPAPESGTWFVRIKGFTASEGISLYANFVDDNWPRNEAAKVTQEWNHFTRVNLSWTNGDRLIDIWRDNRRIAIWPNTGRFLDLFRIVGSGNRTYKICNFGKQECSDEVTIEYSSRR